jgi:hypothetical protein
MTKALPRTSPVNILTVGGALGYADAANFGGAGGAGEAQVAYGITRLDGLANGNGVAGVNGRMLSTPTGMPSRMASSAAARARATMRVIMARGKFQEVMAAQTSMGCLSTIRLRLLWN